MRGPPSPVPSSGQSQQQRMLPGVKPQNAQGPLQIQDSALQGLREHLQLRNSSVRVRKTVGSGQRVGYWALSLGGTVQGGTQVWSWVRGEFTFTK